MHIEKNVFESLIGTLLDIPGKTKDGIAARMDLVDFGVRNELAPNVVGKRTFLPPACYTLSKDEKRKVCASFFGMKVPEGYSSNVSTLVSMKDMKLIGLKSHDCHTLMQQLLPVAIRGVLPKHVRIAITRLCLFFNEICNKVIDVPKLEDIQSEIVTTLCLLEKYFPPSFFDIMVHLTVHLVREVKLCGPVWYRWMYPFERFMRILKGYVRNRNRPEGCIAECYVAEEAVEFCSEYLSNVHTIGIPSTGLEDDLTKPLSQAKVKSISDEEWEQAHLYALRNDNDIDPYVKEHMDYLSASNTKKARKGTYILDEHNKSFIRWLRERVAQSTHLLPEKLRCLFYGPSKQILEYSSYMIDGVTFHTKNRDETRAVQNSGVSICANVTQVASAKDKNPIESAMMFYGRIEEIWELDYRIFRVVVFKCSRVDNNNGVRVDDLGFSLVNFKKIGYRSDPFILGNQAKQVFYIEDPEDPAWSVVLASHNKRYSQTKNSNDLGDMSIQLQCFSKGVPRSDSNNDSDENEPACVREGCDGIWVNNTIYSLGKEVKLMLGDTKNIVGYGTVVATGDKLHGAPMPKNCLRVSIDDVVDGHALLPFPVSDEIITIESALATHVAWPIKLLVVKDKASGKRKVVEKVVKDPKVKSLASLPRSLKALYCMMERSFIGQGLHIALGDDVFGIELDIWILLDDDVIPLCNLEPITGNCIISYIWYLYKSIQENESKDRFLFVNPFGISYEHKVSREDRARKLADRLLNAAPNQLVLVPCNVGEHWILTIIEPYKERIYLMDPLTHRNRDATWKSVVETAMTIFNANKAKNIKKIPSWVVVKGPLQPDFKQCGFYVMRFMKDIVGMLQDDDISKSTLFQKSRYSKHEIDEVLEHLASCLIDESVP